LQVKAFSQNVIQNASPVSWRSSIHGVLESVDTALARYPLRSG
jgi:hypothetical protein